MHCADKANLEAPKSMRDWQKYQEFVTELNGKAGDAIIRVPNMQKEGHVKPDGSKAHGLCLARSSTTICVSGVGGGKTLVALNIAARTAEGLGEWAHIFLLSPNVEVASNAKA